MSPPLFSLVFLCNRKPNKQQQKTSDFPSLSFPLFSPFPLRDSAFSHRKHVFHHHLSPSLPNLNVCIWRKKEKENRRLWGDKCNTTVTTSDDKSPSFICGEISFIAGEAFPFHFLKAALWQTLCRGRHTHKTRCHGAIWIWWQAHYHVEEPWQHCRGEMDRAANQLLKGLGWE